MKVTNRLIHGATAQMPAILARADDGCAIAIHTLHDTPNSKQIPVIFVHALAMDGHMWQEVSDALTQDASLARSAMYAIDCRGHGVSGRVDGPFTTARFAQDLACILDFLGAPQAHVVGCSMGGTVALAFAGQAHERVASLTVFDTTAWYGPDAVTTWERRAQSAIQNGMASLLGFQLERWFSPEFLLSQPDLVQQAVNVFLANNVPAYVESCRMLGVADERAKLNLYRGPATVVVGEHDYATPLAMAQDITNRLVDAHLTIIPGTRHYTPLENPVAVAQCIAATVARVKHPKT